MVVPDPTLLSVLGDASVGAGLLSHVSRALGDASVGAGLLSHVSRALGDASVGAGLLTALGEGVGATGLPAPFTEPFPNGVGRYAVGGLLVGLGVAIIYLATGIVAGASTFLESTLSYVSDVPRFRRPSYLASRDWRLVFTAGIVLGAAVYAVTVQGELWTTEVQWWRLLGGGVLVGVGTRLGKGCTSGHGVCGVGSASGTSLVNVVTFIAVAIGTAQLVAALGVTP